jgi:hypothetical protein
MRPTRLYQDLALNDSTKTFAVPTGFTWLPRLLYVDYTASGDAGNRFVAVDYMNGTIVQFRSRIISAIIANANEFVTAHGHVEEPAETVATFHYLPLPCVTLAAGLSIRVWDTAAIAATADDMLVSLWVDEYSDSPE